MPKQVVCDDGKNEKMVMKNAHEIAILGALSHPNIVQAYTCLTDVCVRDLLQQCMKHAHHAVQQVSLHISGDPCMQHAHPCIDAWRAAGAAGHGSSIRRRGRAALEGACTSACCVLLTAWAGWC